MPYQSLYKIYFKVLFLNFSLSISWPIGKAWPAGLLVKRGLLAYW
jgi:hypothetical protein